MDDWYYSLIFDDKIYSLDKQSFEDFFCSIMKAYDDNFIKVKPSGQFGDLSCDGVNPITNDYYMCYAPEDINKVATQNNAVDKISNDIFGITTKWKNIKRLNYVINDKYKGIGGKVIQLIEQLKADPSLPEIKILSMEALKTICLSLSTFWRNQILGYKPNFSDGKTVVQFDTISNIIKYIEEKNDACIAYSDKLIVPDFSDKIAYNNLSVVISDKLNYARYYLAKVDEFFDSFPQYNKEKLRDQIKKIYIDACLIIGENEKSYADRRFKYVLEKIVYNAESKSVVDNALIILAAFFESCDIFEEPKKEVGNE